MQQKSFIVEIKDAQLWFKTTFPYRADDFYTLEELNKEGWQIVCINDFTDKATRNKYIVAICRKD